VATIVATAAGDPAEIFASPSAAVAHAVARGGACGIHTGEIERDGDAVRGFAVELAARLAALAAPGEVVLSRTVRDLTIGSQLRFSARGEHDGWELFTPA
jgi:class 3 adenylate cyclase